MGDKTAGNLKNTYIRVEKEVMDSVDASDDYVNNVRYVQIEQRRIEQMFSKEVEDIIAMVNPKLA
jgi:hypothetical protein